MSFLVESFAAGGLEAVAAGEPTVLFRALSPGMRLAIWQRRPSRRFSGPLVRLAAAGPFRAVAEDDPEAAVDRVLAALPVAVPEVMERDLRMLAGLFAVITARPRVRVRLDAVEGVPCPRWHADAVPLRLLCTYCGAGTEWLAGDGRGAVPNGISAPCVAVLKGRGFPGEPDGGCLHRSPARAGRRLVLCIDVPGHFPGEG
ncbi:DUF1826 domain-containing protein [Roseomonas populi]|uniref:DUF1826 domain-containing protein n=1 Tax=Roseomonas populi TaxID=3121582 RepID=A0ABT1X989_9PROT|nr:DUF1826 domain-containing protein [Roseomonas pecuniae]MCR0984667.1 DUF1826 domain-containing protein [Roseomonas pecuniae]